MNLTIAQALRMDSSSCMAFVGAGGKTTALFQLARTLSNEGGSTPVIVTATSHLGAWQFGLADQHIKTDSPAPLEELEHGLHGVILVTGEMDGDRSKPINKQLLNWLYEFCGFHAIPLLIEADGSRQKPLKAWASHEPSIPAFVRHVVQVVGLTGVGKILSEDNVHRPEIYESLSGAALGHAITPDAIVHVLMHPSGGLKNIPSGSRRAVLLNQADTDELQAVANGMVRLLLSAFDSVVIASLVEKKIHAVHEPIAGIILAAGEAARYGAPKQLLDWRGQPFIRAVVRTALDAGLFPVVVVTGANGEKIETAVKDLDVRIVRNNEWKNGQASSIKTGISSLNETRAGGAIFLLADQPQVTKSVIHALVEKHAEGLFPIVAPMVIDQRANPVLFDRSTFGDLHALEGDVGGRAIFHKYRVEYLPWHDDRLLLDVDTPEMYQRLISDETL